MESVDFLPVFCLTVLVTVGHQVAAGTAFHLGLTLLSLHRSRQQLITAFLTYLILLGVPSFALTIVTIFPTSETGTGYLRTGGHLKTAEH